MFIVTNCTPKGNYTPSIFKTIKEAYDWMLECTANNIKQSTDHEFYGLSNNDVCRWGCKHMDVKIAIGRTEIYYGDDSYNIMEIFEIEEYCK